MDNAGIVKIKRLKDFHYIRFYKKMGGGKEMLYGDADEDFCKKKWGVNYEKKNGRIVWSCSEDK